MNCTRLFLTSEIITFRKLMKNIKLLLTSVLLVSLVACASVENYQAATRSWIGAGKEELLRRYGAPQQTLKDSNGGEMLVYITDETGTTPVSVTPGRKEIRWEGDRKVITDIPPSCDRWRNL